MAAQCSSWQLNSFELASEKAASLNITELSQGLSAGGHIGIVANHCRRVLTVHGAPAQQKTGQIGVIGHQWAFNPLLTHESLKDRVPSI